MILKGRNKKKKNEMKQKVLVLPLKAKWYKMIESGEKTEEYREIKEYWFNRLTRIVPYTKRDGIELYQWVFRQFDAVRFSYGYTKRTMTFEFKGIETGHGKKEWGAPEDEVYIIKLGKRIK